MSLMCTVLLAEKFLESVERSLNYLLLLLHLIDKADVDMHLRVGASITFKNFVKRNWKVVSRKTLFCAQYTPPMPTVNCQVESRRRCEQNSQLAHDNCPRIRSTIWKLTEQTP